MATRKKTPTRKPTLSTLELEGTPEPYVYVTLSGEEVVFPSPYDMAVEQAEHMLAMLNNPDGFVSSKDIFTAWVGEEDAKKILADKPTYRQVRAIATKITEYYQSVLAPLGE